MIDILDLSGCLRLADDKKVVGHTAVLSADHRTTDFVLVRLVPLTLFLLFLATNMMEGKALSKMDSGVVGIQDVQGRTCRGLPAVDLQ